MSQADFHNNIALGYGGAIQVGGLANIDESTFQDNTGIQGVSKVQYGVLPSSGFIHKGLKPLLVLGTF